MKINRRNTYVSLKICKKAEESFTSNSQNACLPQTYLLVTLRIQETRASKCDCKKTQYAQHHFDSCSQGYWFCGQRKKKSILICPIINLLNLFLVACGKTFGVQEVRQFSILSKVQATCPILKEICLSTSLQKIRFSYFEEITVSNWEL